MYFITVAMKERIEEKQGKAIMRREELEKVEIVEIEMREHKAIKYQTIPKMIFMFELLDISS